MTADNRLDDALPEALLEERRRFSLVWLIPLTAALIAGWLVFKTLSEKGPTITITFSRAEGLEVGKTRIRYKDVEVGKVTDIQLSANLQQVVVTAELSKSLGAHINENTRFWIVRPRISSSGVSGLTTLISGIYLTLDPGEGTTSARHFTGLDEPPRITSTAEGRRFLLLAESLGSLDVGSPVYYRQIQVGEVTDFQLSADGQNVTIGIFVNAPYHQWVRQNSRFWNASGFDVDFSAQGISARLESIASLVLGGITFDTPANLEPGAPGEEGQAFRLYRDFASINTRTHALKKLFVMHFDASLRGLSVGAPVEFRGIEVGKVLDIDLRMNRKGYNVTLPVLVELYPEVVTFEDEPRTDAAATDPSADADRMLDTMVDRGLRAQLAMGNLLTGQLFINLEFQDKPAKAAIKRGDGYPEFPTVPTKLEELARTASGLLAKLDQMPLVEISRDLRDAASDLKQMTAGLRGGRTGENLAALLANLRQLTGKLDQRADPLAAQLQATLKQLEGTLGATQQTLSEDSPLYFELRRLMEELSSTARAVQTLTEYLQRQPDALLRGKADNTR